MKSLAPTAGSGIRQLNRFPECSAYLPPHPTIISISDCSPPNALLTASLPGPSRRLLPSQYAWHPNPNDRTGRILVSRRSSSLCVQPPNLVSCLDSQGLHPRQSPSNAHLYRTAPAACLSLVRSARGCPRGTGALAA
ncbi:hypothetical protein B0H10DRAFT_1205847 [Mycena sp. CBHHK59/15]|nr:hypothetical protein B0H10DRAFT_1205847 [Mycena sp. CBHHK59/15]